MISLIVAMDNNRVIGYKNQLPWHLPADLHYFKKVTTGHPIVMGRKTRDSIGRNLPNRENVIVTRNVDTYYENCTILHSMEELFTWCANKKNEEVFIIGGAKIFEETLSIADRLYLTTIDAEFEGDTYFQNLEETSWKLVSEQKGVVDEKNIYDHTFYVYDRIDVK